MNSIEAQRYARVAGVLVLISLFAGGFGEAFVPGKLIMPGDFHETGLKVAASLGLFRAGFVSYMVEAACDLSLTAIFYLLLRPVSRPLSLIAAFFGLFGTAHLPLAKSSTISPLYHSWTCTSPRPSVRTLVLLLLMFVSSSTGPSSTYLPGFTEPRPCCADTCFCAPGIFHVCLESYCCLAAQDSFSRTCALCSFHNTIPCSLRVPCSWPCSAWLFGFRSKGSINIAGTSGRPMIKELNNERNDQKLRIHPK